MWKSDLIKPTNDWGNNIKVSQNTKNLKCEFKISKSIFPSAYNKLDKKFSWLVNDIVLDVDEYYEILKDEKILELKEKKLTWSKKGLKKMNKY